LDAIILSVILENIVSKENCLSNAINSPSRVTDPEASGFDATNRRGADDQYTLILGEMRNLTGVSLRYALSNESDALDLREAEDIQGGSIHRSRGCKVDDAVHFGVFVW
jgi:hypothetical protein